MADAQRKESLTDWGPGEFEEPLQVLLADYARAELNAIGTHILRSGLVHSLRMRLRTQEWVRRHPEILDEQVQAPIVVVGMMRSGTTLLQRLLAADPRLSCAYGWEVVEVAPRLGYRFDGQGGPDPRIAISEAREAKSRELAPELFTIHPMYAREAEEEIVFLADAFLSHVPESGANLPHYRSWLDAQDFTPAYDYLHRMLQFLQWQKRQRGQQPRRWVLKSPAHLGYLDLLRAQFEDLHLVHMHRNPRTTIASGAGLNATLHAMHADTVDRARVGAQWLQRMGWTNDRAVAARDGWDDDAARVTDVGFDAAVADPIGQVARVYDAVGLPLSAPAEDAMRRWLRERPREPARPAYGLAEYGLRPEQVDERFSLYNKRFAEFIDERIH
ncbi:MULTISPECIES: sulfotransferase family protein [Mycobacterium]